MPEGFRAFKSPDAATTTVTGDWADIGGSTDDVFIEIVITGVATVILEASMDETNPVTVGTITTSTIWQLDHRVPYYRARISAISSGSVTALYGTQEGRNREMGSVSKKAVKAGGPQ